MKKEMATILILLGALSGCNATSMQPEDINSEIDVCEVCNMGISNENFATEVVTDNGEIYKFDDLGCMGEFVESNSKLLNKRTSKQFVRDIETGEWVPIEEAYYAFDEEFWTPMANGVISFKNKQRAENYVNDQGTGVIYDYHDLLKHEWSWEK